MTANLRTQNNSSGEKSNIPGWLLRSSLYPSDLWGMSTNVFNITLILIQEKKEALHFASTGQRKWKVWRRVLTSLQIGSAIKNRKYRRLLKLQTAILYSLLYIAANYFDKTIHVSCLLDPIFRGSVDNAQ